MIENKHSAENNEEDTIRTSFLRAMSAPRSMNIFTNAKWPNFAAVIKALLPSYKPPDTRPSEPHHWHR